MCAYLYCVVCVYVSLYYVHVYAYINMCIYIACMCECHVCSYVYLEPLFGFNDGFMCVDILLYFLHLYLYVYACTHAHIY